MNRNVPIAIAIAIACTIAGCGGALPTSPDPAPPGGGGGGGSSESAVLIGAGDIGMCGSSGPERTARLLDRVLGTIFTAGDNAYFHGHASDYQTCYEPTWGRHKARTRPVPGNHDYETENGAPYYQYFGDNAGPAGLGYYAYTVGTWKVLALNSEISSQVGSAQNAWLRSQLAANTAPCTMAIFHRPLFTSGPNGANPGVREIWRALYEYNADVVVVGHDHVYERFAPQTPEGVLDTARGLRQFTVGTGGAQLYAFSRVAAHSEARISAFGIIVFTLDAGKYSWEFMPTESTDARDTGSGQCH